MSDLDRILADLTPGGAALAIDADLRVELTTSAGVSSTARVTGDGQQVRIEAQRPEVLLAAVDRADVGRVADLLAATGITVGVIGPHGPVATLGAGVSHRFGRVVTGSSHVAPATRGAWRLLPTRGAAPWAVAALAVLALVIRRAQR